MRLEAVELAAWRAAERDRLLEARRGVPLLQRRRDDERITQMLLLAFAPLAGLTVGFYWPMKAEFDPRAAIERWRALGSRAALPVVVRKAAPMQYREWWPGIETTPGVFGLPVPMGSPLAMPDAILVPPVGFDQCGYRLGYGGGYFDRTLAAMDPQPLKIGVAREASRIGTIHPQPFDIPMDFIVTERGVHCLVDARLRLVEKLGDAARIARQVLQHRRRALRA